MVERKYLIILVILIVLVIIWKIKSERSFREMLAEAKRKLECCV